WKIAALVTEIGIGGLEMDRDRIMQTGFNALALKPGAQTVAIRAADGKDVPDVAVAFDFGGDDHLGPGQQLCIETGTGAAGLGPLFELAQLDPQYGALNGVHAVIIAFHDVMVAALLARVAEHADLSRLLVIAGDDDAALTIGAEVLAGIEAEAAGNT